VKNVNINM